MPTYPTAFLLRHRLMASVPKHAHIPPGTPVNIVLKADQRTGKLTAGIVLQRLTKGEHPRGVKVRLADGKVGRVQSLGLGGSGSSSSSPVIDTGTMASQVDAEREGVSREDGGAGVGVGRSGLSAGSGGGGGWGMRGGKMQDDVRNDPVPVEERSLEDYIKAPSKNQRKKGRKVAATAGASAGSGERVGSEDGGGEEGVQGLLEREFSKLDPALIAAIVADHGEVDGAREVLRGLS